MTAGTLLQDTKLPLTTWFLAVHLLVTTRKGVSSAELARKLGVSAATAWHIHRRLAKGLLEMEQPRIGGLVQRSVGILANPRERARYAQDPPEDPVLVLASVVGQRPLSLRLQPMRTDTASKRSEMTKRMIAPGAALQEAPRGDGRAWIPPAKLLFRNFALVMHAVHTRYAPHRLAGYCAVFTHRFDHRDQPHAALTGALVALAEGTPEPYRLAKQGAESVG